MLEGFFLRMTAIVIIVSSLLGAAFPAFADSNQLITYQGRILRPDGSPLEGTIDFQVRIYSPGPSKCLLWSERQTIPMAGSKGAFSLEIGKDINRMTGTAGGGATSFGQVFVNHPNLVIPSTQCNTGYTGYTSNFSDDRTLSVTFSDAGQEVRVVDLPIKSVPFAMQAEQISGYSVNYLFKIAGPAQPGDKNSSLFAKDAVDLLWEIAQNQDFGGNRLKNIGTPTVGTDAASKDYVDAQLATAGSMAISAVTGDANIIVGSMGTARSLSLGTTGVAAGVYGSTGATISFPVITVDMWGRITSAQNATIPFATSSTSGLVTVDTSTGLTINSGTLGLNLTNLSGANFGPQSQNVVFAGPASGGSGAVTFRGLVENDIPVLAATGKVLNSATTATPALTNNAIVSRDATGGFTASAAFLNYLALDNGLHAGTSSAILFSAPMGASYSLVFPGTAPNPGDVLSFDGLGNMIWTNPSAVGMTGLELVVPTGEMTVSAPVGPGDGTLSIGWRDQNARLVFAAPVAGSGQPSFRALDPLDIPDLDAAKITTGTLDVARIPDLNASKITTGILGVQRGGTGLDGSLAGTGQLLIGNGTGGFALGSLFGGSGVIINNQSGSIGIAFNPSSAGVVTYVGAQVPSFMSVAPSGISSSGTFQFSYNTQAQNLVFAAPTGSSGAPNFRALDASDIPNLDASKINSGTFNVARIPDLDASKITTGTLGVQRGGTGLVPQVSDANRLYGIDNAGTNSEFKTLAAGSGVVINHSAGTIGLSFDPSAAGVVTNVGLTAPTSVFNVSGSAVTGAGTLGLNFNAQAAMTVLAAPTGTSGQPTFRTLQPTDIPYLDTSHLITGILPVERGGTGLDSTFAADGQLLIGNGTGGFSLNTLTALSGVVIQNAAGSISIGFDPSAAGVVTNVGLTAPSSIFSVTGSAVTGAGTLGLVLNSQNTATVLAAPTGSSGAPSFRSLIASDITAGTFATARIPDLDAAKITTGTLALQRGGTGLDGSVASSGQLLIGTGTGFALNTLSAGSGVTITNGAGSISIGFNPSAAGVVTNVGAIVPSYMSVSPASISSSGTFAFDFNSQNTATVFAAPTGSSGAPAFRSLIASDITAGTFATARIPDLDTSKITTGTLGVQRGGTGLAPVAGDANRLYGINAAGTGSEFKSLLAGSGVIINNTAGSISFSFDPNAAGVVTNVGLTAPTSLFTVSGSAVTGAGTLGLSLNAQGQNFVFAAPTGSSGAPLFRALDPSDIPSLDASKITTGTLGVARIPDLDASKITTGTLATNRGGTGLDGSAASSGQLMIGNGSGFSLNTLAAGSGVTITNGAGSISIGFNPSAAGVVTNVGLTAPSSVFNVSGSAVTGAGTLGLSFLSQNTATVLAAPTGTSGTPSFRSLIASDITAGIFDVLRIPDLDASKITTGTLGVNRGGTGLNASTASSGQLLIGNGSGFSLNTLSAGSGVTITNAAGSISIGFNPSAAGVVTNVGASVPSYMSVSPASISSSGTFAFDFNSQNTATVFAAPTGSSGAPSFRSLIASDITAGTFATARIPDLDTSKLTTGTLGVERGGTGLNASTAASGQLLIGTGSGFALNTLTAASGVTITNSAGSISIGFNPSSAGVVTNVGLTAPSSIFNVTGSAVTGAGTLGLVLNSQDIATVLAAPTGSSGAPSFRSLIATDITAGTFATARIPDLDASKIVTGTLNVARIPDLDTAKLTSGTLGVNRGGTGLVPTVGDANRVYGINAAGTGSEFKSLIAGSGVVINNTAGSISFSFDPVAGGVVTNVGATVPSYMSVSPASISSQGTFAFDFNSQNTATVFAAPTGSSGAPSFRSLIATDITAGTFATARIPDLDTSKLTTGTLGVQRGGTGLAPVAGDANRLYGINAAGTGSEFKTVVAGSGVTITNSAGSLAFSFDPNAAGVVTNVGLTAPSSVFNVTGSAVTGAGTLGLSFLSQNTATVFAAPTGSSGAPSFRSLIASDITAGIFDVLRIPDLDASKITTGTLGVNRGGTGLNASTASSGQLLIGNGSGFSLNTLSAGSGVTITNGAGSISIGFNPSAAGVVTNVGLTAPSSIFSVTGSAVTGAGTLGLVLNSQAANLVLASPTGASGAPTFRSLAALDIPDLDASKITSGTLSVLRIPDLDASKITTGTLGVNRGGTGLNASTASSGQLLIGNGSGFSLNTLSAGSGVTITNSAGSIAIGFNASAAGVVTNVGATVPSYMSVSPSSISSSGTFAFDFTSQNTATVFAAPTGSSGAPSFRSLIASDITAGTFATARIPDLDTSKLTTGTLGVNRGGTGLVPTAGDANRLYGVNAAGSAAEFKTVVAGSGVTITQSAGSLAFSFDPNAAGVVTNVGLTAPSSVFNVTGSAVTGAGTLGLSFLSQNTATVFAAPTGASGAPSFRSLIASDITAGTFATARIPDLDASKIVTGTLGVNRGGTGLNASTASSGQLLIGTGSGFALNTLTAGSGVTITNSAGSIAIGFNASAAGVVTNVGLTAPSSIFNVTGSAVTGAGTLGLVLNSQAQNLVLASPTGASGAPSFRALAALDIPDLDASKITTGTFATARIPDLDASKIVTGTLGVNRGGTGLNASTASSGQLLIGTGSGFALNTLTAGSGVTITNAAGSIAIGFNASAAGVVTNVGATVPSYMSVSPSSISSNGTFAFDFNSQNTATVFAAPTGASGAPSFRSLIASDITAGTFATARIPDLDASKIVTGTLGVNRGGTGLNASTASSGQLLIGNGTGFSLNTLTAGSGVTITNAAGSIAIGFNASAAGVVTNVGLTAPSSIINVTGSPVSGSGTFAMNFVNQLTATVFAAPTGASGAPSFRSLIASDITAGTFATARIPDLDASKIVTGTLATNRGGTGLNGSSAASGQLLIGTGSGFALNTLSAGSGVTITNSAGSISIGFNSSAAGVVTNVGLTAPSSVFNVTGSAVTGAGTLGLSFLSQNTATVFAAPTGASGAPSFRSLIASDITAGTFATARIPDLDTAKLTTGTLGVNRGGTGLVPTAGDANRLYGVNGAGTAAEFKTVVAGSGVNITNSAGTLSFAFDSSAAGVVTNVGLTAPSSIFNVTGSAVTGAGTLGLSLLSQNTATVFAAPTGSSGAPSFRSLIASDITAGTFATARIPDLDASKIVTGTLGVNRGGTGLNASTASSGQLLIGNGSGFSLNTLTAGSGVTITNSAGSISIGFNSSAAGVVTNVGATVPSYMSVSPSSISSSGTFAFDFTSQNTATVFAAPTGASGAPSFRSLIASDITAGTFATARIPDLDASKITTGTLAANRGGTGLDGSAAATGRLLMGTGSGFTLGQLVAGSGVTLNNYAGSIGISFNSSSAGVVTNVGLTAPSSIFNVTGSAVTGAGTLGLSLLSQNTATVFAAPTGASGAPSFRSLIASDITAGTFATARIPDLDASKITTGTLAANRGGTGLNGSSAASGQLLIGNGTGFSLNTLTAGSGVTITNAAGSISIGFNSSAAGVVTNVGLTAPSSVFNVTGSAVTGAGTLGLSFLSQNTATVFAAPTGASGAPSFRSLIASDITAGTFATARIPDLDASKITTGTLGVNRGGTGLVPTAGDANRLYGVNGSGSAAEYKTLVAGSGVNITNSAGTISFAFDSSAAGVVTNVGLTAPSSIFNVTGSAVTGAGTLGLSLLNQNTATVFAAPTGASGAPSFRSLIASDITAGTFATARIPDLDASKIVTGTLGVNRGGTGLNASTASSGQLLIGNGTGFSLNTLTAGSGVTITNAAGSISIGFNSSAAGVVTNVGLAAPTSVFTITNSPVTSAGTMQIGFANQNAAMVFAAPTGTSGAPAFRALASTDIPGLDASKIISGTLGVNRGGTGLNGSTASSGQLLIGNGTGFSLANLTAGPGVTITNAAGSIAISTTAGTLGWAQGGNSFGQTGTLGTNDNQGLVVKTNNTARMTLTSGGSLGLGVTNPQERLDVLGTVRASAGFSVGTMGAYIIDAGNAGNVTLGAGGSGNIGTSWGTKFMVPNSAGTLGVQLWGDGNSYIASGSLGIGTTTPLAKLHVEGGEILAGPVGTGAGNSGRLQLRELATNGTNGVSIRAADAMASNYTLTLPASTGTAGQILSTDASGNLSWITNSGGTLNWSQGGNSFGVAGTIGTNDAQALNIRTNGTNRINISSAGAIGIGTTAIVSDYVTIANMGVSMRTTDMWNDLDYRQASPDKNANFVLRRSRGTIDSPTYVQSGDIMGALSFRNHNATNGADIYTVASQNHSASVGGQRMMFETILNGSNTPSAAMLLENDGRMVVGPGTMATANAIADFQGSGTTTSSIILPRDTTANRPATGVNGMIRYNTTNAKFEGYQAGSWQDLISTGAGTLGWAQGGNTFGVTGTLGTNDNQALVVKTNNTPRLTVTNAGVVGIGTTSPNASTMLNINNNLATDSSPLAITAGSLNSGAAVYSLLGRSVAANDAGFIGYAHNTTTANRMLGFGHYGKDFAMTIFNTGSVGIGLGGAVSPWTMLHVGGTIQGDGGVNVVDRANALNTNINANFRFKDSVNQDVGVIGYLGSRDMFISSNDSAGGLRFQTANNLKMYLANGGNLQLGTTNVGSTAIFEAYGTGAQSAILIPRDTTANRPSGVNGMLRYNSTTAKFEGYQGGSWQDLIATGAGTLAWAQGGNSFGTTGTLGTNDNQALTFKTNNTIRGGFTNDGNFYIGTMSTSVPFSISRPGYAQMHLESTNDSSELDMIAYGTGKQSMLFLSAARGTKGSSSYLLSGDVPGYIAASPAQAGAQSGRISFIASANWSASSTPGDIAFATTPSGSTVPTERMRINNDGGITLGSVANPSPVTVTGELTANALTTGAGNAGRVSFRELTTNGTNSVSLRAPDALASNYILTLPASTGTNGQILSTDASGNLSWITNSGGTLNWAQGGNSFGTTGTLGTNDAQALVLETNNTPRIFVDSGGSVGVGTTAPQSNFEIRATGAEAGLLVTNANNNVAGPGAMVYIENYGSNGTPALQLNAHLGTAASPTAITTGAWLGYIQMQGYGTSQYGGATMIVSAAEGNFTNSSGPANMQFHTTASGTNTTAERMIIRADGRVGIGTSAPSGILHLVGTTSANSALVLPVATTANRPTGINGMLRYNSTTSKFEGYQAGSWQDLISTGAGTLAWSQGGNSFGLNGTIGTNDAQNMIFKTNNTTRMTLTSGGSLNIGTGTPTALLDVYRNSGTTGEPVANFDTSDTWGTTIGMNNSSGGKLMQFVVGGASNTQIGGGGLSIYDATAGAHRLVIRNGGNVGIGTANPQTNLHIESALANSDTALRITNASNTTGANSFILLQTTNASADPYVRFQGNFTENFYMGVDSSDSGKFKIGSTSGAPGPGADDTMTITNTGLVGIGTTAPSGILHLVGTTSANSALVLPVATTANRPTTAINGMLRYNSSTSKFEGYQAGSWQDLISTTGGTLAWSQGGNSFGQNGTIGTNSNHSMVFETNNTPRMALNGGGSLGIGVTTPENLVDIRGGLSVGNATTNTTNSLIDFRIRSSNNPHFMMEKVLLNTGGFALDNNNFYMVSETGGFGIRTGITWTGDWTTTGTERLRVNNDGRTGIGTTAPSGILHLVGTTTANSALVVPVATTANRPTTAINGMIRYNSTNNKFEAREAGAWVNMIGGGSSQWTTLNGNVYYNTGSVGIGTTTPTELLSLSKNGEAYMSISSTATNGNAGINMYGRGASTSYQVSLFADWGGDLVADAVGGNYYFRNLGDVGGVTFGNGTGIFEANNMAGSLDITSTATNAAVALGLQSRNGGTTRYGYIQADSANNFAFSSRTGSYAFKNAADSADVATITSSGVSSSAFLYTSDRRLKKDITGVEGLDLILKMSGHRFRWISNDQSEIGLIAQEVEAVAPELVVTDETGRKSVKYGNLVAPLIESTKELYGLCKASNEQWAQLAAQTAKNSRDIASVKAENEELKNRVDRLEKLVEKLLEEKAK